METNWVCRTCTKDITHTGFRSIFEEEIHKMLEECTKLIIEENDLPSEICMDCIVKLREAFFFRKQTEEADQFFRCRRVKTEVFDEIDPEESKLGEINEENVLEPKIKIEECELISNEFELKTHRNFEYPETKRLFRCKQCPNQFTTEESLKSHIFTHSGLPFTCSMCPENFTTPIKLQDHVNGYHYGMQIMDSDTCQGMYKCIVKGCPTVQGMRSVFRLPKDMNRFKTWLENVNRMDLLEKGSLFCYKYKRICNLHFEEKMFFDCFKMKLRRNAVPIQLPPLSFNIGARSNESENEVLPETLVDESMNDSSVSRSKLSTNDVSCQTSNSLSSQSPRERKLRREITKLSKHNKTLIQKLNEKDDSEMSIKQYMDYTKKNFSPIFAELILYQLGLQDTTPQGRRYPIELKEFALELYQLSPIAYKSLSSSLHLPSTSTLLQMIKK